MTCGQSLGQETESWKFQRPFDQPEWLRISGHHRTRYETLDGQFRSTLNGSDQIWAFRTDIQAEIQLDDLEFVAEMMDSRQTLADDGTPLNTSIVNSFELLQGYAALKLDSPWGAGDEGRLQIGRQTLDIGSRRLIARNRFRNTVNSFTGIHGAWTKDSGEILQAFYFLPVHRLPADRDSLEDNDSEFDEENFHTQFWGIHYETQKLCPGAQTELYLYGLSEEDGGGFETRDRRLFTTGLRLYRKPTQEGRAILNGNPFSKLVSRDRPPLL